MILFLHKLHRFPHILVKPWKDGELIHMDVALRLRNTTAETKEQGIKTFVATDCSLTSIDHAGATANMVAEELTAALAGIEYPLALNSRHRSMLTFAFRSEFAWLAGKSGAANA